jgi:4-hydroxybutyrate CoA-transferase
VDYAKGALERPPRVVIAEVNPNMPKTHGRSFIHISQVDYIVEVDQPLYELEQLPITEVHARIGQHVAGLVEDGATLQIGYGGVSEAMVHFLKDKRDLGIHTEMVPEGLRELMAAGAVTGDKKSIHQGKVVCTFHGGTTKLYEWLNDNPLIEMQPVDYTNDPKIIAMNSEMVAINAALQVDLFGNIYSDLLGLEDQYTGSGGQLDFAIGCTLAHDAKFVTVLPSTTNDKKSSRIVTHPMLETNNPRAPQISTIPRYYADYVVTEYGVAHLKGRPNIERAKALIQIAHPDFQGILQQQAKELGLL